MSERESSLITAVVAAYNASDTLPGLIDSVRAQTHEPLELVIVDDGSTDRTGEVLDAHPDRESFTVIRIHNGGPSRARNIGVEKARGEWVAFFDSDVRLDPSCVAELWAAACGSGAEIASVGGAQCAPDDDTEFGKTVQRFFESIGFMTGYVQDAAQAQAVETPHNPSCNVLYRRSAFERAGGFDEGLWPGEDVDLDHRVHLQGGRHLFQPRAVVAHYRPASLAAFRRMMTSYGRAQMLLSRRYGFIRTLHYVPPVTAILGGAALGGLWLWPLATALALALASAVCCGFLERLRSKARLGWRFYHLLFLTGTRWFSGYLGELLWPRFDTRPSYSANLVGTMHE